MSFRTTKKIKLPIFNFHPDAVDFTDLLEIFQEALLLIDSSSGRIKLANSKAAELSGYTQEELVNLEISWILPEIGGDIQQSSPNHIANTKPQKLIKRNKHEEQVRTITHSLPSR
ncbi:MAG: PAS domain S-box protein, partial [Anaerolineales bacterium]